MLVGLREASPAEAAMLKQSRITVFTMADIDASGMRDVMREAIRIATTGTRGFHVSYSPTATEIPGWAEGSGGMTVRETHQAMEAIALNGGMISMDVSGLTPALDARVAAETLSASSCRPSASGFVAIPARVCGGFAFGIPRKQEDR